MNLGELENVVADLEERTLQLSLDEPCALARHEFRALMSDICAALVDLELLPKADEDARYLHKRLGVVLAYLRCSQSRWDIPPSRVA